MLFSFDSEFFNLVPDHAFDHKFTDCMNFSLFARLFLLSIVGIFLLSLLPIFSYPLFFCLPMGILGCLFSSSGGPFCTFQGLFLLSILSGIWSAKISFWFSLVGLNYCLLIFVILREGFLEYVQFSLLCDLCKSDLLLLGLSLQLKKFLATSFIFLYFYLPHSFIFNLSLLLPHSLFLLLLFFQLSLQFFPLSLNFQIFLSLDFENFLILCCLFSVFDSLLLLASFLFFLPLLSKILCSLSPSISVI